MILALLLAISPAESDSAAARAVIQRYYAAIGRGNYDSAYRLWSGNGRASGKSLGDFAAGFARTRRTQVIAGAPTRAEGAAGSVFVTVPVRVEATLKNGIRQHFVGRYVLRRVNGIDGATTDQRRWHIASAVLRATR